MSASNNREFHLLDYLTYFVKRKEMFTVVFVISLIVTYLAVFFLIEEQYESSAVLIPRSEEGTSLATGLLRSMKGLTMGMGNRAQRSETDLYSTIIYSRTMLEDLIRTFGLAEVYGYDTSSVDYMDKCLKRLQTEISTKETIEWAYLITVRATTAARSADMVNTIIRKMNERIVGLNMDRSKQNRMFLEKRVAEVRQQLRTSEDSLRVYQERTGLLDAKRQLEGIVTAHTSMEAELAARRIQLGILEKMYDRESPQVREAELQISGFESTLAQMRGKSDPGSALLPLKGLPKTAAEFLRRYREVEINNLILEYITPLYEQAKLDEAKDYPMVQVIDYGAPPARKSWPPRTLFSFFGAFSVTFLVFVVLIIRDAITHSEDQRLKTLLADIRRWTWKSWKTKA
jgi:tyrosine-protein kinase Etk/Wzc